MTYAITNLREVEDMVPKFGLSHVQESRFPREDLDAETIGFAFQRVKPGIAKHSLIGTRKQRKFT